MSGKYYALNLSDKITIVVPRKDENPAPVAGTKRKEPELQCLNHHYILVDASGSMEGDRYKAAQEKVKKLFEQVGPCSMSFFKTRLVEEHSNILRDPTFGSKVFAINKEEDVATHFRTVKAGYYTDLTTSIHQATDVCLMTDKPVEFTLITDGQDEGFMQRMRNSARAAEDKQRLRAKFAETHVWLIGDTEPEMSSAFEQLVPLQNIFFASEAQLQESAGVRVRIGVDNAVFEVDNTQTEIQIPVYKNTQPTYVWYKQYVKEAQAYDAALVGDRLVVANAIYGCVERVHTVEAANDAMVAIEKLYGGNVPDDVMDMMMQLLLSLATNISDDQRLVSASSARVSSISMTSSRTPSMAVGRVASALNPTQMESVRAYSRNVSFSARTLSDIITHVAGIRFHSGANPEPQPVEEEEEAAWPSSRSSLRGSRC